MSEKEIDLFPGEKLEALEEAYSNLKGEIVQLNARIESMYAVCSYVDELVAAIGKDGEVNSEQKEVYNLINALEYYESV